jgi:hypothetical protein
MLRQGQWLGPAFPVTPFGYYRLRFASKAAGKGYWAIVFFDAAGKELTTDVCDGVYASADWQASVFCFRSHALAATARLRFWPIDHAMLLDDVAIEATDGAAAAAWADGVAAAGPRVRYTAPADRWQRLAKTMRTLQAGGTLRVVILGDSIACDTSNSLFETHLARVYPKAKIEVVTSVRGGTGCRYYKDENRVEDYVLRFKPDLVVIAGISHGFDVEPIRSVIRQIRAASACEIMVMTGAFAPDDLCTQTYLRESRLPAGEALDNIEKFVPRLRRMAAGEQAEFLDLRAAWEEYLLYSSQPHEWFMRDRVHANSRGKQVVGRILLRYFEPKE